MTTPTVLGLEPHRIANPHSVPPELDQVMALPAGVPGYSETAFLTSWNPEACGWK